MRGTLDEELNRIFFLHRFGFDMSREGKIQSIGSEALQVAVIRPALLRLREPRFSDPEDHFQRALDLFRAEESRRAIFEAGTAVEAMLRVLGYRGERLEELARDFSSRSTERGYISGVISDLASIMRQLYALRSDRGGHAAQPGDPAVPEAYALLAIHLAGAIIVFLADRAQDRSVVS